VARGRVRVVGRTRVGDKVFKVRKVSNLVSLVKSSMEATAHQNRVLAEETRELIIDRLMAALPQAPARDQVDRPERLRRPDISTVNRAPFSSNEHPPLAESTVRRKARLGLDGRKLIETGELIGSIEIFRGVEKGQPYYMVRLEPRQHRGSKSPNAEEHGRGPTAISLNRLMRMHEFGTSRMPARPTWRPVSREIIDYWLGLPHRETIKAAALRALLRGIV